MHTHAHTFYACRHILSLAGATGRASERASGQVNGAMIIMTLATMSCGGCWCGAAAAI